MEVNLNYGFDQDSIIRLQKDLNHLLTNLDSQNVRKLYTEYCDIRSKNGLTVIDGALVNMYDYDNLTSQASTTLRLRMGYNASSSNFCFKLFNNVGEETISLDSCGNAVFKGDIDTAQDVNVGNNIFIGNSCSLNLKGIYFNSTTPITATSDGYHVGYETSDGRTGLFWDSFSDYLVLCSTHRVEIAALNRIYMGVAPIQVSSSNTSVYSFSMIYMTTDLFGMAYSSENFLEAFDGRINLYPKETWSLYQFSQHTDAKVVIGWKSSDSATIDTWLQCSSNGIGLYSSDSVYLGVSTGNAYLGLNAISTNLVASRGWVGAKTMYFAKSTESMVTNSTVLYPDPHMTISLEANTYYLVEAILVPYSSEAQRIVVNWTTDGYDSRELRALLGPSTDSVDSYSAMCKMGLFTMGGYARYGVGVNSICIREHFAIRTRDSTARITLQYAQKTASTVPLRMSWHTRMIVHKLT